MVTLLLLFITVMWKLLKVYNRILFIILLISVDITYISYIKFEYTIKK